MSGGTGPIVIQDMLVTSLAPMLQELTQWRLLLLDPHVLSLLAQVISLKESAGNVAIIPFRPFRP